jgi:hypothetical protein
MTIIKKLLIHLLYCFFCIVGSLIPVAGIFFCKELYSKSSISNFLNKNNLNYLNKSVSALLMSLMLGWTLYCFNLGLSHKEIFSVIIYLNILGVLVQYFSAEDNCTKIP